MRFKWVNNLILFLINNAIEQFKVMKVGNIIMLKDKNGNLNLNYKPRLKLKITSLKNLKIY